MYDTIIIGRDLSSLISAIAASRREVKTVLIMEGNQELDHQDAGYSFPIDPTPLSGFGHEQTVFRLFKELRLPLDEAPQMLLIDPAFQVILPDHRVNLFHDPKQLIDDMIREFPQKGEEIKRIYNAISGASTLIERWIGENHTRHAADFGLMVRRLVRLPLALMRRSSLMVRGDGNDLAVKRLMEAQIAVLSHLDTDDYPLPLSAAYLLSLPARGLFHPAGGRSCLIHWLRKAFTDSGGILMDRCSVMRIDTKQGIIVDLEHSGASSTTIRGKRLIVSANWEKLYLLLFHQKVFRRLVRRLGPNCQKLYPFLLHLGIREGGLPESMAPYVLVVTDEKRPARDHNLIFIESSLPGELSRAPAGRRALSAMIFLKDSPLVLSDAKLKEIAMTIIDSLEGFLPFLRESIDYVNIEKSIICARQSQEIVNQKYRIPQKPIIGIKTFSPATPVPNVFLTGGIFHAGLGFEGEVLSGIESAFLAGQEDQWYAQ